MAHLKLAKAKEDMEDKPSSPTEPKTHEPKEKIPPKKKVTFLDRFKKIYKKKSSEDDNKQSPKPPQKPNKLVLMLKALLKKVRAFGRSVASFLTRQYRKGRYLTRKYVRLRRRKRRSKKTFQNHMKDQGKKKTMMKQTSDILPFLDIYNDYIILKDGVMDILQVNTSNISSLNEADIEYLLLNQAQFLRSYFPSYKEVVLNFPTNVSEQRAYWLNKRDNATSETRVEYIDQKLYELDFLENERYNREFFIFLYADDKENLLERIEDCMLGMQSSFPLMKLKRHKKEQVLFLLNNQNSKLH